MVFTGTRIAPLLCTLRHFACTYLHDFFFIPCRFYSTRLEKSYFCARACAVHTYLFFIYYAQLKRNFTQKSIAYGESHQSVNSTDCNECELKLR